MNKHPRLFSFSLTAFLLASLACGFSNSATTSKPTEPIASITIGDDLTKIDVCAAIPQADMEAVMDRKLVSGPQHFEYYDAQGASGCMYDAGKDPNGTAHFGYVVLTPIGVYNEQPLYQNVTVSGIGDEAYFNNGADARQLWVRVDDKVAFVVAFGDQPNEDGEKAIAQLLVAVIK